MKDVLMVVIGGVLLALVWIGWMQYERYYMPKPGPIVPEEPVFCTADAKLCPDGSGVGRVPPSCEFAPCPGEAL